ncbi:peptidylprolyl isomerase [Kitasatospora sp. NPDC052896]|uniref:peptidylprolyl isomerase n=1 Tax=Kitasatospora sp. NPDC052896 TaxID=3364061 RepID=UPI0037C57E5A
MTARPIVATVGDHTITTDELDARLDALRSGPFGPRLPEDGTPAATRLRRWVAGLLAAETLIRHEAGQLVVSGADPFTQHTLAGAARDLFTRVTSGVTVEETELRRYYHANPDRWTRPESRTLRQAVRPTSRQAAAVAAGALGPPETVSRGQFAGAFEDAVFAVGPGERIGPVRTVFGWHVAILDRVEPAHTLSYRAVRATIRADLLTAARGSAFDDWLARRRAALVHLAPGYEHPGDPSLPDHSHRH